MVLKLVLPSTFFSCALVTNAFFLEGPPLLKINVKGWSKNILITSVPNDNTGIQPWKSEMTRRGTWYKRKCYEFP